MKIADIEWVMPEACEQAVIPVIAAGQCRTARMRVGIRSANNSALFGSPSQDGFEVLETLDSNQDGKIDAADAAYGQLRVWRDLDQDGVSDVGELQTLGEAGITSFALTRTDVTGSNAGHDRGFASTFTRANGTTGTAETIYFQTDRQNTADPTPAFTAAAGIDLLPQLPRSGTLNQIAWNSWAATDDECRVCAA